MGNVNWNVSVALDCPNGVAGRHSFTGSKKVFRCKNCNALRKVDELGRSRLITKTTPKLSQKKVRAVLQFLGQGVTLADVRSAAPAGYGWEEAIAEVERLGQR